MRLIPMALTAATILSSAAWAQSKAKPAQPEPPPLAWPGTQPELALPLPSPAQPPLDLSPFLKNTNLCVFPFLKESARGNADKAYLDSIQKTFFDVAKESPLLKDAVLMGPSLCDVRDTACFSEAGKQAHCQNVLVGSSAAKGNGYVLSVRMVEVGKNRIMPGSEVEQVLETDRQSDVQAWAEGQACRALQVTCVGRIYVDADRKDMNIYVDNRLAPRGFKTPEQIAVEPGVHGVRVSVGQRTSLEKKVSVRRNGFSDLVYARQTDRGGDSGSGVADSEQIVRRLVGIREPADRTLLAESREAFRAPCQHLVGIALMPDIPEQTIRPGRIGAEVIDVVRGDCPFDDAQV